MSVGDSKPQRPPRRAGSITPHAHRLIENQRGRDGGGGLPRSSVPHPSIGDGVELWRLTEIARPTLLQALRDKRLMAVLLLSFASGLPYNLTGFTVQAWLASEGLDIRTIGIFTLVSLPYLFKFLWAPFLDRYLPPILGRRRGWILIYQMCLTVAIAVMGFCSPTKELYVLGTIAVFVAILSASQDIVIDAYRVDAIPVSERGLACWPAQCWCWLLRTWAGAWPF
jgi:Acetyl-coenzyme A transporter 1